MVVVNLTNTNSAFLHPCRRFLELDHHAFGSHKPMRFSFRWSTAHLRRPASGRLPIKNLDADVIIPVSCGIRLYHLIDLDALSEPEHSFGFFTRCPGYFHFKQHFKKADTFFKMCGVQRNMM